MGTLKWLTRRISSQPIAVHFSSDVVRFMQIKGSSKHVIHNAIEVAIDDIGGISEALSSFQGNRCVVCVPPGDVLVQHIRIDLNADEENIRECLIKHHVIWGEAEIRTVCIKTTGVSGATKQELLCVGINRESTKSLVASLESAGAVVVAVTIPLYASVRAFDFLNRRDGDEKVTSMIIDMDEQSSMAMIAHGALCVFAHRIEFHAPIRTVELEQKLEIDPSLLPVSTSHTKDFERRDDTDPRGLCSTQHPKEEPDIPFAVELERCLRHHDALFPDRVVDRIIFTGCGAIDTERCAAIAAELEISGFIADPSAWIEGAEELAAGPSWTTAAGMCLRYSESAA
jgi:Tfp pilus assembly PilM family ATPase